MGSLLRFHNVVTANGDHNADIDSNDGNAVCVSKMECFMLLSIELMKFKNVVSTNKDLYGVMDSTDEISECGIHK